MVHYELSNSALRLLPNTPPPPTPPRDMIRMNNLSSEDHIYEHARDFETVRDSRRRASFLADRNFWILIILATFLLLGGFLYLYFRKPAEECSSGYTHFDKTGYCYKAVLSQVSFNNAKYECEYENAHLASIHSQEENTFLKNHYHLKLDDYSKKTGVSIHDKPHIWLGLVYLDGLWQWTDGTKEDYEKWGTTEPNNMEKHEFWTAMVVRDDKYWAPDGDEWANFVEDNKYAYFCKKPSRSMENAPKFTTMKGPVLPRVTTLAPTIPTKAPEPVADCQDGYTLFNKTGFCYKVVLSEVHFLDAKFQCESENAHLASIHSKEENTYLKNYYHSKLENYSAKTGVSIHDKPHIWLGLVYLDGLWQWTDGTKEDYEKWGTTEPNNMEKHEYWTAMVVRDDKYWAPDGDEWANFVEDNKYAYFCKKPSSSMENAPKFTTMKGPVLPRVTTLAPTVPTKAPEPVADCHDGYTLFNKTGFCYKVVLSEVHFLDAKFQCESENAHLASIHSKEENTFLKNHYHLKLDEYSKKTDVTKHDKPHIWLGLVYLDGLWQWTDGTKEDYEKWGTTEPNNMGKHEYWTAMVVRDDKYWAPDGDEWANFVEDNRFAYFCKKPSKVLEKDYKFTTIKGPVMPKSG